MARHTIQIPINKSSNQGLNRVPTYEKWDDRGNTVDYTEINISPVSNRLVAINPAGRTGKPLFGIGLAWDGEQIPKDKYIVSARLYFYSLNSHNRETYYRYVEFSEGSSIPSRVPADGVYQGGMSVGWDYIDIGELKGNSIVIYPGLIHDNYTSGSYLISYAEIWETYSHRNPTNKPYLEIVYDDIPPEKPTSLYPSGTTLSTRDVIRFSWLHNSKEGNQQKGFTLQYSTNGGTSWTTVNQTTPNQYYDLPANTSPTSGAVMWRVKTKDDNDSESEYSTASFTLGVVPQKAPIPISPISQYLDENNPIRFEWNFVGGSPSEHQSKFDLQYSTNGGASWTTKTVTTNNNYYEVPANTFSGGNITWRVRTYNNWNEVSPYSENRSFTVIGSPPIPQITNVSNSGKPLIKWQSTNQHIYEIEILKGNEVIFESGSIPSTGDREFKLPIYLNDGNYLVKLRIYNEYNLFSVWAEKSFIISTTKPHKPIIEVYGSDYSVTIKGGNQGSRNLIYRDNILIGELTNNIFIDFTGINNKEYKYFIRIVDNDDNFSDSEIKLSKCKFPGNTLALAEEPGNFIKLKYGLDSIPRKLNRISRVGSLQHYDGRKYPVAEYTEFRNKDKILSFVLKTKEELEKLIDLIDSGKTLLYRDNDSENIYGNVFTLDYTKNILGQYKIGFTIEGVDYD